VTTGTIRRAKLQSDRHHQQTNIQLYYRPNCRGPVKFDIRGFTVILWRNPAMSHTVNSCPLTKFDGGLLRLHEADEAAVDWLTPYGS